MQRSENLAGVKRTYQHAVGGKGNGALSGDSAGAEVVWAKLNSITKLTVPNVRIKTAEFGIGRHPDNDLHISDGRLSGFHCRIIRLINVETGAMEVYLEDLSTNGTFKNGVLVSVPRCD